MYFLTKFSLGNFGGSTMQCVNKQVFTSQFDLTCEVGRLDIDNIDFGVMSEEITEPFFCEESAIWNSEQYKNKTNTITHCTDHIDKAGLMTQFKNSCRFANGTAKIHCMIDFSLDNLYSSVTRQNSTFQKKGNCGGQATFYAQVPCLIPKELVTARKIDGLMFGSLTVFVYLFVVIYFDYIKCIAMNTFVDWDVKSITAGDYSVEFDLDVETYERF